MIGKICETPRVIPIIRTVLQGRFFICGRPNRIGSAHATLPNVLEKYSFTA